MTYKPDIADQRESPAVDLAKSLAELGAEVRFHDPYVTNWGGVHGTTMPREEDLEKAVAEADLVVLVQNHKVYDVDALVGGAKRFFDTRGVVSPPEKAHRL